MACMHRMPHNLEWPARRARRPVRVQGAQCAPRTRLKLNRRDAKEAAGLSYEACANSGFGGIHTTFGTFEHLSSSFIQSMGLFNVSIRKS